MQVYFALMQLQNVVPEMQPLKPGRPPAPAALAAVQASPVMGVPVHGSSPGMPPAPKVPAAPVGAPPLPGAPLEPAPPLPVSAPPAGFPGTPEPAAELLVPALLDGLPPDPRLPPVALSSLLLLLPQAVTVASPIKKIAK